MCKSFKNGNFVVKKHPKRPKTVEDAYLQALVDEDDVQTNLRLAEAFIIIQ